MQNENIPTSIPSATTKPLSYISICSGIEGATVAFHPLGWKPLAFAEIEAFPSAVLAHHYPAVPNLGDMTKFMDWPEELLAECDLLVGGPPCTAFSVAGLRKSLDDPRGNLTLTYVKLINHIDNIRRKHGRDPIISLFENVPGIYSTKDNAFGCLVGAICGQDAPVETETGKWPTTGIFWGEKRRVGYRTLDAQYFGLAQRRRRCFLVAVPNELVERLGDGACPSEILSIAESLRGDSPPSRKTGQGIAGDAGSGSPGSCWWDGGEVSQTLDAVLYKGQTMPEKNRFPAVLQPVTHSLRAEGFDSSEDGTGRGTPLVPVAYRTNAAGQVDSQGDCTAALTTMTDPASQFIAFSCKDYGADAGETAPTLRAMGHAESHANAGGQVAVVYGIDEEQNAQAELMGCLKARMKGGGFEASVAIPIQEVGKRTGISTTDPRAGVGIGSNGDPMYTLQSGAQHAVAFAQNTRDEVRLVGGDGQVVGALAAEAGMKQQSYVMQEAVAVFKGGQGAKARSLGYSEYVAPTLPSSDSGSNRTPVLLSAMAVRRITPTEAERLQGYEDGYTLIPYRGKPAADGPRYKSLGNSFAILCIRWIGYRIQQALETAA